MISYIIFFSLKAYKFLSKNFSQAASSSQSKFTFNAPNNYAYENLTKPEAQNTNNYICPSIKGFKFSINDFKIEDIIKRHELSLPEIAKNKVIQDPLLLFQIEKELPHIQNALTNTSMYCGQSLFNERHWRSRKMNIKKKKKYEQKLFYVFERRRQNKDKRFENIKAMYAQIHDKKTQLFDTERFMNRELEKAKFYGFTCSPIYDEYRKIVNEKMQSFDQKYFRKFEDVKKPIHMKLNIDLNTMKK
jgi:hypothetical protein